MILAQAVDGETDGVGLLLGVKGLTGGIHRPVDTTHLAVNEMVTQIFICAGGSREILRVAQHPVCGGECPQQTAIQDSPLGRVMVGTILPVDTAEITATRGVGHTVNPEREDIAGKILSEVRDEMFGKGHCSDF